MERIRRQRPTHDESPTRLRRSRPENSREEHGEWHKELDTSGPFPVRWVQWNDTRCLYIGKHLFGTVSPCAKAPHLHKDAKWAGNVHVTGICGPVAYGDNPVVVQNEVKKKAMEWLAGFKEEAPAPVGGKEEHTRRKR